MRCLTKLYLCSAVFQAYTPRAARPVRFSFRRRYTFDCLTRKTRLQDNQQFSNTKLDGCQNVFHVWIHDFIWLATTSSVTCGMPWCQLSVECYGRSQVVTNHLMRQARCGTMLERPSTKLEVLSSNPGRSKAYWWYLMGQFNCFTLGLCFLVNVNRWKSI